jgi:hypothetical protein
MCVCVWCLTYVVCSRWWSASILVIREHVSMFDIRSFPDLASTTTKRPRWSRRHTSPLEREKRDAAQEKCEPRKQFMTGDSSSPTCVKRYLCVCVLPDEGCRRQTRTWGLIDACGKLVWNCQCKRRPPLHPVDAFCEENPPSDFPGHSFC